MARRTRKPKISEAYDHKYTDALLRPDIGTQAQFRKKKPPVKYRYDPTLDPELSWDINADRERAEALIFRIENAVTLDEAKAAAQELKKMSQPFLNWAGKAENGDELPKHLYHYTDSNGLAGIIQTREVWATEIHHLSDTSEFRHAFDLLGELLQNRRQQGTSPDEALLLRVLEEHMATFRDWKVFVCSLSEEGDLLSQWREYCPNGGYSLEFDSRGLDNLAAPQGMRLMKCHYDEETHRTLVRQRYNWHQFLHSKVPMHAIKRAGLLVGDIMALSPLLKDSSFSEEKEWRLISGASEEHPQEVAFRKYGLGGVPYIRVSLCDRSGAPCPLTGVRISPTGQRENLKRRAETIIRACHVRDVSLMDSSIPLRTARKAGV